MSALGARLAAALLTAILAGAVVFFLLRIPVQVTDSLVPLLQAQTTPSVAASIRSSANNAGYLRPLRIAQIQILYDLAAGRRFYAVFRGFHALLVVAAFALFVVAFRPRTVADVYVLAFGLAVLTGLHTFLGTVWEAYPINHFLEIAVFCLAALVLTLGRPSWWADLLACVIFAIASLTLESGLLVWVVVVAATLVGARGVTWRGVVGVTLLLGVYLYLRFFMFNNGVPTLVERASGFWTSRLEPAELIQRFGAHPVVFYVYNVVSSLLSVLLSEPRAGVWAIPLQLSGGGRLLPGTIVNVTTSTVTTAMIGWFVVARAARWWHRHFERDDQILLVAFAVIAANAVISYGYTKDEVLSTAGMFYALGAAVALRAFTAHAGTRMTSARQAIAAAVVLVVCAGWVVRTAGLYYHMQVIASNDRYEWVEVDSWLDDQHARPVTPEGRALVQLLRDDALGRQAINPWFFPRWAERWFQ